MSESNGRLPTDDVTEDADNLDEYEPDALLDQATAASPSLGQHQLPAPPRKNHSRVSFEIESPDDDHDVETSENKLNEILSVKTAEHANGEYSHGEAHATPPNDQLTPEYDLVAMPERPLFTEMMQYMPTTPEDDAWLETARWIKFEEKVEIGSRRWSKPHIATPSLVSLLQLSACIADGSCLLDLNARSFTHCVEFILDDLVESGRMAPEIRPKVAAILKKPKLHQYEQFANHEIEAKLDAQATKNMANGAGMSVKRSQFDNVNMANRNPGLFKKLPLNCEATNVLVGEAPFLTHHIAAFVRLRHSLMLSEITEVPLGTRFIFVLLGPVGHSGHYQEIGRALGTMMADKKFASVPFRCRTKEEFIEGMDDFLDGATVLPPGTWNPEIRIAPQEEATGGELDEDGNVHHEVGHGNDPALKRSGHIFGGLVQDIRRKIPHYASDFSDGLNMQSLATFFFMYFAVLAPAVTFGALLQEGTGSNLGAMENVLGAGICGVLYHLFSGQPLTILGSTGPVLVFESLISMELNYLPFRAWINIWIGVILMLVVCFDGSAIIKYVTRFTEECFATLIALIFVFECFKKLSEVMRDTARVALFNVDTTNASCYCLPHEENDTLLWLGEVELKTGLSNEQLQEMRWYIPGVNGTISGIDYAQVPVNNCTLMHGDLLGDSCLVSHDIFFISLCLTLGTFVLATLFKKMRYSFYFPSQVRVLISDFAIAWAILAMVALDVICALDTPKLNVPSEIRPTNPKRLFFLVNIMDNPVWSIPLSIAPALLASILIFMDQQITGVIVNRHENKLKKGCGYHLDLFILAFLVVIVGVLGLPIFVAATVRSMNHVNSLKIESESRLPGEIPTFQGVREQRLTGVITFLALGLSVYLSPILQLVPMPVLYGVFLYMGISALDGIQLWDRIQLIFMPMKYQPDLAYLRHVSVKRVHSYTLIQVICLTMLWVVKSINTIAIAFPIMLIVMVIVRSLLAFVFTKDELQHLDDELPEMFVRRAEDKMLQDKRHREGTALEAGGLRPIQSAANMHVIQRLNSVASFDTEQRDQALKSATDDQKVGFASATTQSNKMTKLPWADDKQKSY